MALIPYVNKEKKTKKKIVREVSKLEELEKYPTSRRRQ